MSDGKYALTPLEAALTTTRGGNPLFDHPTLWLGGAQPAKSDPDHGVIREMSG